ncbi:MAG: hypothetical protein V1838_03195 [Patescibacteria group bacterium]
MFNKDSLYDFKVGDAFLTGVKGFETLIISQIFSAHNRWVAAATIKNGETVVVKVMGEATPLTEEVANQLGSLIDQYRRDLELYQVPIPETVITAVATHKERYYLIEFSPFMGESLETVIYCSEKEDILKVVREALNGLSTLFQFSQGEEFNGRLPVGIDLIPRNFTCSVHGKIRYVDFMAPKIWCKPIDSIDLKDPPETLWPHVILEYPPVKSPIVGAISFWRHFTKEGILLVFLQHLAKLKSELYHDFFETVDQWLRSINEMEVLERLKQRPFISMTSLERPYGLIENVVGIENEDIYTLRDATILLSQLGLMDKQSVNKVFEWTHFQWDPVPPELFSRAKNLVLNAASSKTIYGF